MSGTKDKFVWLKNSYIPIRNIRRVIYEEKSCEIITYAGADIYSKDMNECVKLKNAMDQLLLTSAKS